MCFPFDSERSTDPNFVGTLNSPYLPFPVSSEVLGVSGISWYALGTGGGVWERRAVVTAS
jgi:hypothetical protein